MVQSADFDLTPKDIGGLASADAIAGFLTDLGYPTGNRKEDSPTAYGLSPTTADAIRNLELLAEDGEGFFRVLFVRLKSVTAKVRNELARNLGKRNADHLLILTKDFEHLEFVLIDKETRQRQGPGGGANVRIIPRIVSVPRKSAGVVERRVLRRLTWTSKDGLAQFEKLRSVFESAHYSGRYFQNRALFADHFLDTRLREGDAWKENPSDAFAKTKELMRNAFERWFGKDEATLRTELFEPAWKLLGFKAKVNKSATEDHLEPDYLLSSPDGEVTAAFVYRWDRWLDGADPNDTDTQDENPGAAVVSALADLDYRWIIVTNGKLWRLYSREAHSRATNFYEVNLDEALVATDETDPNESFRYWWLFFRQEAFSPFADTEDAQCWLDTIVQGSRDYAKKLGERLKERVFVEIFPHLAQGFLHDRKKRIGEKKAPSDQELTDTFEATLTLLYRLLFLLYAESRDLLPMTETAYKEEASLYKIKEEIAAIAGGAESEAPGKVDKKYSTTETSLYDRLLRLFAVMDQGDDTLNVPCYNGGLFITKPDADHDGREHRIARFLLDHKVPDRFLAKAIDRLARDPDEKTFGLVFIDYKSLEVRHLGSIYEGLLEFKLKIADEDLATKTEKKREKYIPLSQAKPGRGRKKTEPTAVVRKGEVYLSNDKAERKATGSYYTPDPIVKYIVEHTVGPVLDEKLDALKPDLKKAGATFNRHLSNAKSNPGLVPKGQDHRSFAAGKTYAEHRGLVDRVFDIKVLDPAMGSGHFLVEAVDFITDRLLDFLNRYPNNPVVFMLDKTRRSISEALGEQGVQVDTNKLTGVNLLKRHVLKRCIYGVDLNPMAVELAKVSLWLDAFTLGAPLSFLDHHLRCGNSLIGATFEDLKKTLIDESAMHTIRMYGIDYGPLLRAIQHVLFVNEMADATAAEVHKSADEYSAARNALSGYQIVLDTLVADYFIYGKVKPSSLISDAHDLDLSTRESFLASLRDDDRELLAKVVVAACRPDLRFFHWEIEFPEVFFDFSDAQRQQVKHKNEIESDSAGFDAIIGNPPYDVLAEKELGYDVSRHLRYFKETSLFAAAHSGKTNLYKLFIARGLSLPRVGGTVGHIVPMPLLGDKQAVGLRKIILGEHRVLRIDAFPQHIDATRRVFQDANLTTCIFVCQRKPPDNNIPLQVRTHPEGQVIPTIPFATPKISLIKSIDPNGLAIPPCTFDEWNIIKKLAQNPILEKLGDRNNSYQGEVNETNNRDFLTDDTDEVQVLRGAHVCRYALRDSWRQNDLYLEKDAFLRGKSRDSKAFHHLYSRVGFQRSAPQNNFRRLIAAPIPIGAFCFDTVSYFIPAECSLHEDLLLALLNSEILDWYFDLGSTNSKVNEYRLNLMPVPCFGDQEDDEFRDYVAQATEARDLRKIAQENLVKCEEEHLGRASLVIRRACSELKDIEKQRKLKSHMERSSLDPVGQAWQDVIDAVLFEIYGLTEFDREIVARSLAVRRRSARQE